jgi:hypothetical protein
VEKAIRKVYGVQCGGLRKNGAFITEEEETIQSDGNYEFVNFKGEFMN